MTPFAFDIAHCRGLQIDLEATTAFATFGNGLLAMLIFIQ